RLHRVAHAAAARHGAGAAGGRRPPAPRLAPGPPPRPLAVLRFVLWACRSEVYPPEAIDPAERSAPPRWWDTVTPTQLRRIRTRLTTFAEDLFQSFPRKDQRRWGQSDLGGLMLDGRRKSIQPMAA